MQMLNHESTANRCLLMSEARKEERKGDQCAIVLLNKKAPYYRGS
jgi:hypothetical protein